MHPLPPTGRRTWNALGGEERRTTWKGSATPLLPIKCNALCYIVCVREIRWSDESEDHIWARHQVTPAEVEQTVNTRPRFTMAGREGVELVYGTTDAGRYLLVVLAEAMDGRDYIVTARDMDPAERRNFTRQAR